MTEFAALDARLEALHSRTSETPLFNPVFQLGLELSRRIESGELSLDGVETMVAELECEALRARAERLHRLIEPVAPDDNLARLKGLAETGDFPALPHAGRARWRISSSPRIPPFCCRAPKPQAVAAAATSGDCSAATVCVAPHDRDSITLDTEHAAAMTAMARGQFARDRINAVLLRTARQRWPDRWQELRPQPLRFASWVGYDMDGRTDIGWHTCIRYRLEEKAQRLGMYADAIGEAAPELSARLSAAADRAAAMAALFAASFDDPAEVSAAANTLTADHPDKLTSLSGIIGELEALAAAAAPDIAEVLLVAAAAMRTDGLGMGWIHFRVNSSQLQNAIRRRIDPDGKLDLASQAALVKMRELLAGAKVLRSNFAALAMENSTAVRLFLTMAEILHHIDSEAPIRMLVAECEQPTTMLAALYFAKLFGIADKVDVSPSVRNRKRAGAWRAFPRRAAGRRRLSPIRPGARPGRDPDRFFRCRALRRADPRRLGDRALAGAAGRGNGRKRAGRCLGADLQYAWRIDGARRASHLTGRPAGLAAVAVVAPAVRPRRDQAGARGQLSGRRRLSVLRHARTGAGDADPVHRAGPGRNRPLCADRSRSTAAPISAWISTAPSAGCSSAIWPALPIRAR